MSISQQSQKCANCRFSHGKYKVNQLNPDGWYKYFRTRCRLNPVAVMVENRD